MIHRFSVWLADKLARAAGKEDKTEQIRYGIEVMIGATLNPLIVFSIAVCLKVWQECLSVALTFATLRMVMGGYHFKTFTRCLVVSLGVLIGASYVAKFAVALPFGVMSMIITLTGVASIVASMEWAPANEHYRKISSLRKRDLRRFAILMAIVWLLGAMFGHHVGISPVYLMGSVLGVWIQILVMPNAMMKQLDKFERL
jgi:accessory gene regulator B